MFNVIDKTLNRLSGPFEKSQVVIGVANLALALVIGIASLALTLAAVIFAYRIGEKQNEINQVALEINDFAEIFVMPRRVIYKYADGEVPGVWNIIIKNASAYPIYLNSYTLDGKKVDLGNLTLARDSDLWYGLTLPTSVQEKGEFSISVDFEDYRGNKYRTKGSGVYNGRDWWNVTTQKRMRVDVVDNVNNSPDCGRQEILYVILNRYYDWSSQTQTCLPIWQTLFPYRSCLSFLNYHCAKNSNHTNQK